MDNFKLCKSLSGLKLEKLKGYICSVCKNDRNVDEEI
jgi:hypothetical protein